MSAVWSLAPAAQVCWPRCPANLRLKNQTGEVAEARGRDDLGDKGGNTTSRLNGYGGKAGTREGRAGCRRKEERKAIPRHVKFRKGKQPAWRRQEGRGPGKPGRAHSL